MHSVAIINGSKKFDGTLIATSEYSKVLSDNGYETHWYQCLDTPDADDYLENGVLVDGIHTPIETLSMGINRLFVFHKKLQNLREDIVFLADPTLIKISDRNDNVIVKVHDFLPMTPYRPKYTGYLMSKYWMSRLKNVERIIVTTEHVKSQVESLGIDPENIYVVPEPTVFLPDNNHITRSIERIASKKEINLLYIATDKPYKNLEFFINLSKIFSNSKVGYKFNFNLVSKLTPATRRIVSNIESNNLIVSENVKNLAEVFERTDVLLYPSLFEGFGRPIIEAMRFGMPLITNDIQPFREIVGSLGMKVSVDDLQGWVDKILSLTEPETYKKYAELSFRGAKKYSEENFRKSLLDAFNSAL